MKKKTKITRKELRQIIEANYLNEGFFDSISNLFKSEETKELEKAELLKQNMDYDKQLVSDHFKEFNVIAKLYDVYQDWHPNDVFVCEDINGKRTMWYQSGRERIMVQIAGVGFYSYPPGHRDSPGTSWICKSTPLKRPYAGTIEEKIYQVLNTYANGFDSRDALSSAGIKEKLKGSRSNRLYGDYLTDLFRKVIVKSGHDIGDGTGYEFNSLHYEGKASGLNSKNPIDILNSAMQITSLMANDSIEGSDFLMQALRDYISVYSKSQDEKAYQASLQIHDNLIDKLGYNSMPASNFDSSWADELYEGRALKKKIRSLIHESLQMQLIPPKYQAIINTIPDLSLAVIEDPLVDTSLDLQSGEKMIASVQLRDLTENDLNHPCIPNTLSISSIHTSHDYQELGIGELMFDLVFYYAELKGYGITTDFDGGNTPIINYIIKKALKNDPSYYKQVTKMGNDTMDFFDATADPDDDCYSELFDIAGVYELINDDGHTEEEAYAIAGFGSPNDEKFPIGTTSSWRKRGIEALKPLWDMLTQQDIPGMSGRRNMVRSRQFRAAYQNTPTPEEIRQRQKEKRERIYK